MADADRLPDDPRGPTTSRPDHAAGAGPTQPRPAPPPTRQDVAHAHPGRPPGARDRPRRPERRLGMLHHRPAATVTGRGEGTRRRGSRGVRAAAVAAVALVAALAAAAILLTRPGSSGAPPLPPFVSSRYDDAPRSLRPAAVSVTSVHEPAGDRRFGPELLVDDDLTTAWNSAAPPDPDVGGEVLVARFPAPVRLRHLDLANGDQSSDEAFLANARVRRADVVLDGDQRFAVAWGDHLGWQRITFATPRLTTRVRIEVTRTYPGDTFGDLGVSELAFHGWIAHAEDR